MNSQVIFKIDKKVKEQAMRKAQKEGLPLASVLKLATKAYAEGQLTVGLFSAQHLNAKTSREVKTALKNIRGGKNLSPRFRSSKTAALYLAN